MTFQVKKYLVQKLVSTSIPLVLLLSFFGWTVSGAMTGVFAADLVNINLADAETISSTVDGIGPVKAQAIVDYRQQNGKFTNLEDLQKVPGIGQIMFDRIKASLSLTDDSAIPPVSAQIGAATQ